MFYPDVALKLNCSSLLLPVLLLTSSFHPVALAANHKELKKNQYTTPTHWDKKFYLNGITITPGGFFAGEGVWRARSEQADIGSTYTNVPLGNSPLYYLNELRLSARQSRLSTLVEGSINPDTQISGYVEADFLGNGSANENESNSFDLRIRSFYADVDWNNTGWHFLAGQNWSLITLNSTGISPRNELIPPTIDAQYVVGFAWKRQAQFRLTKNFGSHLWLALSAENSQYTEGGSVCGTVGGANGGSATGTGGFNFVVAEYCFAPGFGTLPSITNFSFNRVPDLIGKVAFESDINGHQLHLEGLGLYRNFYNRVWTLTNHHNENSTGWGAGGGFFFSILPQLLDIQGNVLAGQGIGSYLTGQLPDTSLNINGGVSGIPEVAFMGGTTVHANPRFDVYVFGGKERQKSRYFIYGTNYFGFGLPNANNTGCYIENGTCQGNTRELWLITAGFWDKLYQGNYGELRAGMQYSFVKRELFSGYGGTDPLHELGASTNDHMILFSVRYFPFIPAAIIQEK